MGVELLPTGADRDPADRDDGGAGTGGSCSEKCENDHGTSACVEGSCVNVCETGYADCDGNRTNGCETPIMDAVGSCGACDVACENPHGSRRCVEGVCAPRCSAGYADCDDDPVNGCEAALDDPASCGGCDRRCVNPHGATACESGECAPTCEAGFASCNGDAADGCEANLESDPRNCGACGRVCGASQICVAGACEASPCGHGLGECDGDLAMSCETELESASEHCGFCGNACVAPHASARCAGGMCSVASCQSGYADCDGAASNGCEVALATSTAHCGGCGRACSNAHGTTSCRASTCAPTCSTGFGDCDGSRENGCETSLDSVANCGACGRVCAADGGTATCSAGVCGVRCDLSGDFAVKLTVPVSWPASDALRSGSGTYTLWFKLNHEPSGSGMAATVIPCARTVPPLSAILVNESFLYDYPAALWAPPRVPSATVTATSSGSEVGSTYALPFVALVMGANLADPVNAPWPSRASGLTSVDHDGDGKAGVTALYRNGGGFSHPRVGLSLFAPRASRPYAASRTVFSLNGRIDSCARSSGSASVRFVDTRMLGCRLADNSRDCNAAEADFLDRNAPDYRFGAATYSMVRVAGGATCAEVEAAVP